MSCRIDQLNPGVGTEVRVRTFQGCGRIARYWLQCGNDGCQWRPYGAIASISPPAIETNTTTLPSVEIAPPAANSGGQ